MGLLLLWENAMTYMTIPIHDYHDGMTEVKVDPEDYSFLSQWSWKRSGPRGYARRTVRKPGGGFTTLYMHDLLVEGKGTGLVVDHINGDPLDNRRANLRVCTQSENVVNQHIHRGICRSQGVAEHYGKYQARINRNKERIYLGRFNSIQEATEAIYRYDGKQNGDLSTSRHHDEKTRTEDSSPTYHY